MLGVLRTPRWIALTLFVAAAVTTFVRLGFWQLDRLDERRAYNQRFVARQQQPERSIQELFPALPASPGAVDANAYGRATATGRFDVSNEIVVLSRSHRGISGHHVLTPLVVAQGRALLVDRGWVPEVMREPPLPDAAPPDGEVMVRGVLFPSQVRGLLGPQQPAAQARQLFRIEIPLIQARLPYTVYPLYLQSLDQQPSQRAEFPTLITDLPSLDEGPHRSYAIQWFAFALAALATYAALLRKANRRPRETPAADSP